MKDLIDLFKMELEAQSRLKSSKIEDALNLYNEIYQRRLTLNNKIGAIKTLSLITKTYLELGNLESWSECHEKLMEEIEKNILSPKVKRELYSNLIKFYQEKEKMDVVNQINVKIESIRD